jgi:hypothetical protein
VPRAGTVPDASFPPRHHRRARASGKPPGPLCPTACPDVQASSRSATADVRSGRSAAGRHGTASAGPRPGERRRATRRGDRLSLVSNASFSPSPTVHATTTRHPSVPAPPAEWRATTTAGERDGVFELTLPLGTAPASAPCPECGEGAPAHLHSAAHGCPQPRRERAVRHDAIRHLLRHGASPHERELHHPHRTAAVAARMWIGKRRVTDNASAHCVPASPPFRPTGDAHARRERRRAHLTPGPPGAEGEVSNDEPAQHVGAAAGTQARLRQARQGAHRRRRRSARWREPRPPPRSGRRSPAGCVAKADRAAGGRPALEVDWSHARTFAWNRPGAVTPGRVVQGPSVSCAPRRGVSPTRR